MLITSPNNEKVKEWKRLKDRKYRLKQKKFLVEGQHLVLEAYKEGYIDTLILEQNELLPLNVETVYVSNEVINSLSDLESIATVMAVCNFPKEAETFGNGLLVIDEIQDPGNLGMIIRSAVAFNIETIIIGKNTVDVFNPKCIRATQGMIFHINIIHQDLFDFLHYLSDLGYFILGTKVTHGKKVEELPNLTKYALVVGNEGNGIREEILDLCDDFVYIEMNSVCESLNVSVASSIILNQLHNRR